MQNEWINNTTGEIPRDKDIFTLSKYKALGIP